MCSREIVVHGGEEINNAVSANRLQSTPIATLATTILQSISPIILSTANLAVPTRTISAAAIISQSTSAPAKEALPSIWLVIGVAVGALLLCGVCGVIGSAIGNAPSTTQQPVPTIPPTSPALLAVVTSTPKATATLKPKPTATATPKPTATTIQPTSAPTPPTPTPIPQHTGVNGTPWGYDFNPGKYIYIPPSTFCHYFNCIPTFYAPDDPGDGYSIECQDSTYSQSGGERGACSSHGGELRPLYSH